MFIRFFKDNKIMGLIALPILTGLVFSLAWLKPPVSITLNDAGPLYHWTANYINSFGSTVSFIASLVLLIAQVFYLDYIINKYEVLYKPSHLGGLMYLVCMTLFPGFLCLHPVLFVNLFLLVAVELIFSVYKSETELSTVFNIGFVIAIATLFYTPTAALFILVWISLILLRPYAWRDWVVGLIGFFVPFFFIGTYYLWVNKLTIFLSSFFKFKEGHHVFSFVFDNRYYLSLGIVAFFLTIALLKLQGNFYKNFIRTRRYQQVMGAFLILSAASVLLATSISIYHFTIIAIPLSIFVAYYFLAAKKLFWSELFFLFLVAAMVYNYIEF